VDNGKEDDSLQFSLLTSEFYPVHSVCPSSSALCLNVSGMEHTTSRNEKLQSEIESIIKKNEIMAL
jgi:hypothetical protein